MYMAENPTNAEKIGQKTAKLDERDKMIVNLLNRNSRLTLKEISREVGLSIDGVKGRIDKMKETGVIEKFTIIPNPKFFGFPLVSHVYIRLQNITDEALKEFERYLRNHSRVIVLMSMVGDYDMYFVILAKDTIDLNSMKNEIRMKFRGLIADWKEVVVAKILKYEEYKF
ncbi:putative HTH-type transcriptional regulator [uncultured archaeon]|nr:putative HTH-type transcriptional regulator [uncultured archaeon]